MTIRIHGTGCSLMDYLYTDVDFSAEGFTRLVSKNTGDGGLTPGALVFTEHLEEFTGEPLAESLKPLVGDRNPDCANLGGPAVVALINAAQLLFDRDIAFEFFAGRGNDEAGAELMAIVEKTPLGIGNYQVVEGATPCTTVLSDPNHHDGKGERTFINTIGAAGHYLPDHLGDDFFKADILLFGATALVPVLHDHLADLLKKGREAGAINVVTTVYDFRNEERAPDQPWPLGDLSLIDLLVTDAEEALKISGQATIEAAVDFFIGAGVGAAVVTHGAKAVHLASRGGLFAEQERITLPVSAAVDRDLENPDRPRGDTTGCGDNFAGGVLTSLAAQLDLGRREDLSLIEACAWGGCSGGFACFYPGGTMVESHPGEKMEAVGAYYIEYCQQIGVKANA
ncbi:MAG: carbohydrate kinase family protein [Planctomycetota bacterium]|jgi:sugar/nucleoside kinase (ribokinase family)